MEFQIISFATALVGSSLAGLCDLKTTEIPDEIPYAMIAIALILYGIQSYLQWSYWPLLNSLIAGLSLLGFGFMMYYLGQWGGGDAKTLSAIGFLIPTSELFPELIFPFPFSYLINVFLIGAAYMLIYAFVLSLINRKIISKFVKDLKSTSNVLLVGSVFLFVFLVGINWYLINFFQTRFDLVLILRSSIFPVIATLGLFAIWKFARSVEDVGFKRTIPISKLKVGDVLEQNKLWEGITEKELIKIKKSGKKYVRIKEGVRFAPAFPLALLFTLYFGDGLFFLIKLLM
ncbi:MAG: prepilin peptidase [Candidatus Aenigmarchaeota archaeon]|nr:prepilin peptidase [Candidatus Aenigmarchaeota archaeon]